MTKMEHQGPVLKTDFRSKIHLFVLLIIGVALTIPLVAILLYAVNVDDMIICNGTIVPEHYYELPSPVDGNVREIYFHVGDEVKRGDIILQIDDSAFVNERNNLVAEIAVLKAQINVKHSELTMQLDVAGLEEKAQTIQAEIVILQSELQVKQSDLQILRLEPLPDSYKHAQAHLEAAQKAYDKARESTEQYRSVLTKIELEKYEKQEREAKLELEIRKENARIVAQDLGDKFITKAEENIKVTQAQIKEKQIQLELLNKRISDFRKIMNFQPGGDTATVKDLIGFAQAHNIMENIRVIQRQIDAKNEQIKVLEQKISDCKIIAVQDGILLEIPCKQLRYAEKGKKAAVIASHELMVQAEVPSRFIRKVEVDQEAQVSSEIFSKLQYGNFLAVVEQIYNVPLDGTSNYPVKLRLNTEGCDIKIGSKAEVRIITGSSPALYWFLNIVKDDETAKRLQELRKARKRGEHAEQDQPERNKKSDSPNSTDTTNLPQK